VTLWRYTNLVIIIIISWYRKGKASLDLNEAREKGVLGCRQITTPTPHHSFFTGQMLFLTPNRQR